MKSLKWSQVGAWRLAQHGLSPRLEPQDCVEAVARTGGIQAQVMSAAELALWARVQGLTPEDVESALWRDRTLVKTWAMRATLHLIPSSDLPLYVAARGVHESRNWLKYFEYFGISEAQYEAFVAAVPQVLGSEPMTREQLAAAVAEHTGIPELDRSLLASSWGSMWKPSAWRGDLCFGPNQGRNVTFVRPGAWTGEWQPVEPYPALQEMARRYLRAYGPATPEGFARWWGGGFGLVAARKLFRSLDGEMEAVDVEGRHALALSETLEQVQKLETPEAVRLLPLFDAYTFGLGRDLEPVLPREHEIEVFRPQGWITAVVLVNGLIEGVWEFAGRRSRTIVRIRMFSRPEASTLTGIEAEAERLSAFLNTGVELEFEEHGSHSSPLSMPATGNA